jgi:hypothetical protein
MCLLYFRLAYQLLYDRMAALDLNEGKRFPLHGPSDLSVEDTQSSFDVMAVAWRDPRAGLLTRVHGLEQASAHSRRFVLCLVGVGERDTGARITGNGQLPKSAGGCLLKNKKTPLGYACLDETPDLQTGGARSRNHKKMGCPAKPLHTDRSMRRACSWHIFWTELQYRGCIPISIGSIG